MENPTFTKDCAEIMAYLQAENESGHAHNLDMLLASLNWNQIGREALLNSLIKEEEDSYILTFPLGIRFVEFRLSKKAVHG